MRPTPVDIARAIKILAQSNIAFFPTEDLGLEMVRWSIESFVGTQEQLVWLTHTACNTMKRWSIPELRGIFCSRYAPADGLYTSAETPGYTPAESARQAEQAYLEREQEDYERKLQSWKMEAKLLGEPPRPFEWTVTSSPQKPKALPPAPPTRDLEAELAEQASKARKRTKEEEEQLLRDLEAQLQKLKKEKERL